MIKNKIFLMAGFILLIISLLQLFILKQAHFYALFSLGLFLIFLATYERLAGKKLFNRWKFKNHFLFWTSLLLVSILIDKIGLFLGYWVYPHYSNFFDDILKYTLEYAIALAYIMIAFLIGFELFKKLRINKIFSYILSLIIFVVLLGIITEFLNLQIGSWKVLNMPFTNYQISNFFVIWQTIGFWLMAIIPFIIYKLSDRIK